MDAQTIAPPAVEITDEHRRSFAARVLALVEAGEITDYPGDAPLSGTLCPGGSLVDLAHRLGDPGTRWALSAGVMRFDSPDVLAFDLGALRDVLARKGAET